MRIVPDLLLPDLQISRRTSLTGWEREPEKLDWLAAEEPEERVLAPEETPELADEARAETEPEAAADPADPEPEADPEKRPEPEPTEAEPAPEPEGLREPAPELKEGVDTESPLMRARSVSIRVAR